MQNEVPHHVDCDPDKEGNEIGMVFYANAVVDPRTMVIELVHATVAVPAVLGTEWFDDAAGYTDFFNVSLFQSLAILLISPAFVRILG